jgi:hypothetical protein
VNGSTVNDTTVLLRWTSADPEGDSLGFTLELTDGAGLNLSEDLGGRNRTLGLTDRTSYTWRVIVSDGMDTVASPAFSFTVRVNRPPVIHSVPVLEARPGRTYAYQVVATDPDQDRLRFHLDEGPEGMGMTPEGKVLWVPWTGQAGKDFKVAVTVSDGGLGERQEFTIKVSKAGAPAATAGPSQWTAAGLVVILAAGLTVVWILLGGRRGRG